MERIQAMNSIKDHVTLSGIDLEVGDSVTTACPECGRENKFSITRDDTGLLYNCYRDSCSAAGYIGATGVAMKPGKGKAKPTNTLRPYDGDLRSLRPWERARFLVANGLTQSDLDRGRWKWAERWFNPDKQRYEGNCYAFPVMDPRGSERGVVLRRYDGREPKALTRMHTSGPLMSWYVKDGDFSRVILVEDQVSALKVSRYCTCVAILGTAMSHEAAREVSAMQPDNVTIALDEDAINTAYKIKKWYGLLFRTTTVVQLHLDPKDMSPAELHHQLGV